MEQGTKSFLAQLQEWTRQGANSAQDLKAQAKDSTTTPSLERARKFVLEEALPAIERAAHGGVWHTELSLLFPPGIELNREVLIGEIRRLLLDRGVRADVLVWPRFEHIVIHVSWLPPLAIMPPFTAIKQGKVAIFASDLRGTGTVKEYEVPSNERGGKPKKKTLTTLVYLFLDRRASIFEARIDETNKNYMVELVRDVTGDFTVRVYGQIEVQIVGTVAREGGTDHREVPDSREYIPVKYETSAPGATIVASDLRDMRQAIYEAVSGKGEGGIKK